MKRSKYVFTLLILLTPALHFAQLSASALRFLEKKAQSLALSDTTDFSDLKKLDKVLRNKQLVLLGESTHGAREMNLLKNRLIRYLHEELGFKVLLLESGIGEIYELNYERADLSSQQMLHAGLMGPWQSEEFVELTAYLKQHPALEAAGFDVQRTGSSFSQVLAKLDQLVTFEDGKTLSGLEEQFSNLRSRLTDRNTATDEQLKVDHQDLVAGLQQAMTAIQKSRPQLTVAAWDSAKISLIIRSLQNRIDFANYYYRFKLDNDFVKRFAARDSVMAANVRWLIEEIYPNEKFIISAHNHHISRYNEQDFVMGEKLAEVFGDRLYAIGFFPGKGSFANNARKAEQIEHTDMAGDLQQIILQNPYEISFLPIPAKKQKGSEWLFEPVTVNNTFINLRGDKQLTLNTSFNALIMLRQISPALY